MTIQPPSSAEGSPFPSKLRANLSNLAAENLEKDLWAFDSAEADASGEEMVPAEAIRISPVPKGVDRFQARKIKLVMDLASNEDLEVKVGKNVGKFLQSTSSPGSVKVETEFDDLAHWDERGARASALRSPSDAADISPASGQDAPDVSPPVAAAPEVGIVEVHEEFSSVPKGGGAILSMRPNLGLSLVEKIGMGAFLMLLVVGGGLVYFFTLAKLPSDSDLNGQKFPVNGVHFSVLSAGSFWRAPVTSGGNRDTFRRGTVLLPVLSFTVGSGQGAFRVLFRDSEGKVIGDAVTQKVSPGLKLNIAATAGFEEAWMHDAYRVSEGKPWVVEVLEAPSETSQGNEFKRLFEMNISSDRR